MTWMYSGLLKISNSVIWAFQAQAAEFSSGTEEFCCFLERRLWNSLFIYPDPFILYRLLNGRSVIRCCQ